MMQTPKTTRIWTRLLAITLAGLATLISVSGVAAITPDEQPLTPAQEASIREEMSALADVLMQGGKSPQEAKLAVNAVGVCFRAAYSHGMTRYQAYSVCGEVLDAFTIQKGTTAYALTADDQAWITSRTTAWTSELSGVLEPEALGAVRTTMQSCLDSNMRRGDDRETAVRSCAKGLLPLLNQPELQRFVMDAAANVP
jgi:hypothetical protein